LMKNLEKISNNIILSQIILLIACLILRCKNKNYKKNQNRSKKDLNKTKKVRS
jgi:hypothetical protein